MKRPTMLFERKAIFVILSSVLVAVLSACASATSNGSNASESTIGYPSIEEALEALHAKSHAGENVVFSSQNGWTIVEEQDAHTIWSFTPADHPAHPAVVKRALEEDDQGLWIRMTAMCGADKASCDEMIRQFERLNDQSIDSFPK